MTIDIIIPNYNGSDLIEKNLSSVLKSIKKYNGKIIIVDDGSEKEDVDRLKIIVSNNKNLDTEIILVEHQKNLGFSSAINSGVRKSNADFVALLNSDVVPHENFLESPLENLKNKKDLFAVGCMDESVENRKIILRGRGVGRWENGFVMHSKGEVEKTDTFWVSGGSGIFNREVFQKLGGMDTLYNPFYWEDIDLSFRAQKSGYEILFDHNSKVSHLHEKGAIKKYFKRDKVITIAYRNQFIFVWKNITDPNLLTNHFLLLPKNLIILTLRGDIRFLKGFFLALGLLPDIIKKRKWQKNMYQVSDMEVIHNIS